VCDVSDNGDDVNDDLFESNIASKFDGIMLSLFQRAAFGDAFAPSPLPPPNHLFSHGIVSCDVLDNAGDDLFESNAAANDAGNALITFQSAVLGVVTVASPLPSPNH